MDTATYTIITTVAVGGSPVEAAFGPKDAFLAIVGFDSNTVTIVNPVSYTAVIGKLPGPLIIKYPFVK
jgi:DNA-binding beta-propeller fold protein YncE